MFSYWLGEGIDGFVVQSAAFLYEDPKLEDGFVNEKASIKFIAEIRKLIGRLTRYASRYQRPKMIAATPSVSDSPYIKPEKPTVFR